MRRLFLLSADSVGLRIAADLAGDSISLCFVGTREAHHRDTATQTLKALGAEVRHLDEDAGPSTAWDRLVVPGLGNDSELGGVVLTWGASPPRHFLDTPRRTWEGLVHEDLTEFFRTSKGFAQAARAGHASTLVLIIAVDPSAEGAADPIAEAAATLAECVALEAGKYGARAYAVRVSEGTDAAAVSELVRSLLLSKRQFASQMSMDGRRVSALRRIPRQSVDVPESATAIEVNPLLAEVSRPDA